MALLAAGIALIALVAGCQSSNAVEAQPPTPTIPTRSAAPSIQASTGEVSATVSATGTPEDAVTTLTFWTVEAISPAAENESGEFMEDNLQAFEQASSNIEVELLLKKASGKGGMLDFLRTARDAAPSVLPDVAVLNVTDLSQASQEGLILPLSGRLNRSIVQDLLPAARRMGTVDGVLMGVPLSIEMEHTAYNTGVFEAVPLLWTDVLSASTVYLFPAKGVNGLVNDATLSQYFSAAGDFFDEQGQPIIDDRALRDVLDFYHEARLKGVVDDRLLEAATVEELWPLYLAGEAGIAQVSVRQYLLDQGSLNSTAYAPIPVQREKDVPTAVVHGWVLVLVTNDPARQNAALSLIEWFLSTSNNVTWNDINYSIPTRDSAYQELAGGDPYWTFLTEQLNAAQPQPAFNEYDRLGRIIQQAVEQVISGEATPEEATATAMDLLAQ